MKNIIRDGLHIFAGIAITAGLVISMSPPPIEQHANAQAKLSTEVVKVAEVKAETTTDPAPKVEEPVAQETPVEETAPTTAPVPATPKVDSSIPARVFCGSPAQRSWKTPLLVNATMGREMAAAKGWTGAQWDALLELWSCESSWNNFAQNPSSAFGIAQFLDSTWGLPGMKQFNCQKTVDAREQIRCGLEYIAVVYGTPQSALANHYRENSY
jgi:hypothetical protein